jgi:hypothetical protein
MFIIYEFFFWFLCLVAEKVRENARTETKKRKRYGICAHGECGRKRFRKFSVTRRLVAEKTERKRKES